MLCDMIDGRHATSRGDAGPRRSPGANRQRDAERARRLLLDAALDEFAAKGFAGARTQDIAARAGVNKQLIAYYFGGKEGLYRAVRDLWLGLEQDFVTPGMPFEELIDAYARNIDRRMARLLIWEGLHPTPATGGNDSVGGEDESVADLRERQRAGEIAADLDPRYAVLAMMGALLAPIAAPQLARRVTGLDPESPEFMKEYRVFLRQLVGRLK
jgi:TetR/AcrR family transcriptional regulator